MKKSGKQQWILDLALVLCLAPTGSEGNSSVFYNCSGYKFICGKKETWTQSSVECKKEKGFLVAMETIGEWEFINNQIQGIKRCTEWFIGLKSSRRSYSSKEDRKWSFKWITGKQLDYDKWYRSEPSGKPRENYAKMIKDYNNLKGTFDDTYDEDKQDYICEYPRESNECTKLTRTTSSSLRTTTEPSLSSSSVTQSKTIKVVTAAATTTTSTATTIKTTTTTTKPPTTTSKSSDPTESTAKKTTFESRIITSIPTSHTAFLNTKTEVTETPKSAVSTTVGKPKDHQKSDNKQDDGMMIIYIAVSLAVVLIILICVLGVCYWKRLKKEKRKISEDKLIDSSMATSPQPTTTANVNEIMKSSSFVAFKMVHNNLSDSTASSGGPVYDNVCTDNNQGVDKGTQLTDTNEGSQGHQNVSVKKKKFSLKRNKGSVSESNRISKADEVKMNEVSASTSTDENKSSDEVVYAAVDKTKKNKVIQEVTYADLAPFNNNAEVNVHKPEPYQPVEYAVIIGKKASKSSK